MVIPATIKIKIAVGANDQPVTGGRQIGKNALRAIKGGYHCTAGHQIKGCGYQGRKGDTPYKNIILPRARGHHGPVELGYFAA